MLSLRLRVLVFRAQVHVAMSFEFPASVLVTKSFSNALGNADGMYWKVGASIRNPSSTLGTKPWVQ